MIGTTQKAGLVPLLKGVAIQGAIAGRLKGAKSREKIRTAAREEAVADARGEEQRRSRAQVASRHKWDSSKRATWNMESTNQPTKLLNGLSWATHTKCLWTTCRQRVEVQTAHIHHVGVARDSPSNNRHMGKYMVTHDIVMINMFLNVVDTSEIRSPRNIFILPLQRSLPVLGPDPLSRELLLCCGTYPRTSPWNH